MTTTVKNLLTGSAAALLAMASVGYAMNMDSATGTNAAAAQETGSATVFNPFDLTRVSVPATTPAPMMMLGGPGSAGSGQSWAVTGVVWKVRFGPIIIPPLSPFRIPPLGPGRP